MAKAWGRSPFTEPLARSPTLQREPGAPHDGGCSPLYAMVGLLVQSLTPSAPGMGHGPKTQALSRDATLESPSQNLGACRETEAESTHLDFVPVVFVLLQHAGRVEWGLWHHHGLLKGAPSPWIRTWDGTGSAPHPFPSNLR